MGTLVRIVANRGGTHCYTATTVKGQFVTSRNKHWDQDKYVGLRRNLIGKARGWNARNPEDAVDEAFSRAMKQEKVTEALNIAMSAVPPEDMESPGWLQGWLTKCLYNVVLEQYQSAKRTTSYDEMPGIGDSSGIADRRNDPLEILVQRETMEIVRRCISCLKKKERQALHLRAEGWSHQEIAAEMDTNVNTVAWYIAEGKKHVRECVERRFRKGPGNPDD